MERTKAFYDLCIQNNCLPISNFAAIFNVLTNFGYKTIAINQTIICEEAVEANANKKKKKGGEKISTDLVPLPNFVIKSTEDLKILNRLTVVFSEKSQFYKVIQSDNFKKYHIIAVIPKTTQALQFACESLDVDIISFDPKESNVAKWNRKLYMQAVERRIYFEISYFPAIQDTTSRKNTISKSHLYHQYGKSKNVIITSGAVNHLSLRGPYDVVNLGLIFGLSEEQSKSAISTSCTHLINRAEGRRMGKALIMVRSTINTVVSVIESDEGEVMDVADSDEPVLKKTKVGSNDDSVMIVED